MEWSIDLLIRVEIVPEESLKLDPGIPPSFLPCATSAAVGKSLLLTSGRETTTGDGFTFHAGLLEGSVDVLEPPSLLGTVLGTVC